jgi:fructose-1-phosphate kinase PfkB-like protein
VDEEFVVSEFRPGGWFRSRNANRSPGGKGINVSLLLSQLGVETAAMGFLAGFNGGYIRDVLRKEHITTNFVHVKGETRTNVYIVDETGKMETGISETGPYVPEEAYERFMKNYDRMLKRARLIVLGGSLPPGVPQDAYACLIRSAKDMGVPVWIDAAGAPLMSGLEAVPSLAKIDHRLLTNLHEQGIEWSITSYHTYGDLFFTPEGIFLATSGRKDVVSLFGASDALMAGMIVAREENMTVEESIRFSLACGWEDATHVEKGISSRKAVEEKMDLVQVEKL